MSDKKFTPKEAALAVLKKAEELLRASSLAKSEPPFEAPASNPDEKEDAELGEEVESAVEDHQSAQAGMKGHIKLAKFMGRMEHKKGQKAKPMDKVETGKEPLAQADPSKAAPGVGMGTMPAAPASPAHAGAPAAAAPVAAAKSPHEQTLDQIHQMSKPKLG